jgi:hypothetical protein
VAADFFGLCRKVFTEFIEVSKMVTRTSVQTVTFQNPFVLPGIEDKLPAGNYRIEIDEEVLEGVSFLAYRRLKVALFLPVPSGKPGFESMLTIHPKDLDTALACDRESEELAAAAGDP